MNVWKPIALCSFAGLVLSVGAQIALAKGGGDARPIVGGACHDQPNMAAANSALHSARASLNAAEHDKGGWRTAAIAATDKAIAESDRGCAFADTH